MDVRKRKLSGEDERELDESRAWWEDFCEACDEFPLLDYKGESKCPHKDKAGSGVRWREIGCGSFND